MSLHKNIWQSRGQLSLSFGTKKKPWEYSGENEAELTVGRVQQSTVSQDYISSMYGLTV